jgi:hypothetical protein
MWTELTRRIRALRGWRRQLARGALIGGTVVAAVVVLAVLVLTAEQLLGKSILLARLLLAAITCGAARIGWYFLRLTSIHVDEVMSTHAWHEQPPATVEPGKVGAARAGREMPPDDVTLNRAAREAPTAIAEAGKAAEPRTGRKVLYLRSFAEDNVVLDSGGASIVTADSLLGGVLRDAGPVVGLARPGDHAPPLGVATSTLDASVDWKPQIEAWIRDASLVVIQAGTTQGLLWELQTARRLCAPEQLIVSFLAWQHLSERERESRYQAFVVVCTGALAIALPSKLERDLFWCFEPGWQLTRLERPRRARLLIGQWARSAEGIREVLRASMRARGIHLNRWRTVTAALLYPAVLLSMPAAAVLFAIPHITGQAAREAEAQRLSHERVMRAISDMQKTAQKGRRRDSAPVGAR